MDFAFVLLLLGATGVIVLGAGGAAVAFTSMLHFQRWTFQYLGRHIEVHNYLLTELVTVDGARVHTDRDGDGSRYVRHLLRLDNGRTLRIWIRATSTAATCLVDDGSRVVFASDAPPDGRVDGAADDVDDDPRLPAARVLLADLTAVDPRAAGDLEVALERLLAAERGALLRAAAHAALGGDGEELVVRRSSEVDELLTGLRDLHLAVTRADPTATVTARRALAKLGAIHEVG